MATTETVTPVSPSNSTSSPLDSAVTRRGFLRGAAVAGGGLVVAGIAACAPGSQANWTTVPAKPVAAVPSPTSLQTAVGAAASPAATAVAVATAAGPSTATTPGPSIPAGWTQHDIDARNVVRR